MEQYNRVLQAFVTIVMFKLKNSHYRYFCKKSEIFNRSYFYAYFYEEIFIIQIIFRVLKGFNKDSWKDKHFFSFILESTHRLCVITFICFVIKCELFIYLFIYLFILITQALGYAFA